MKSLSLWRCIRNRLYKDQRKIYLVLFFLIFLHTRLFVTFLSHVKRKLRKEKKSKKCFLGGKLGSRQCKLSGKPNGFCIYTCIFSITARRVYIGIQLRIAWRWTFAGQASWLSLLCSLTMWRKNTQSGDYGTRYCPASVVFRWSVIIKLLVTGSVRTVRNCGHPVSLQEKIVHWPPTNQWTASLQPYSLLV